MIFTNLSEFAFVAIKMLQSQTKLCAWNVLVANLIDIMKKDAAKQR